MPPHLAHAIRQIHDFVSIGAAAPLQEAGAFAYRMPREYYSKLATDYDPTDKVNATTHIARAAEKGEVLTGLLYLAPDSEDLHAHLNTYTMWHSRRHLGFPGQSGNADLDYGLKAN